MGIIGRALRGVHAGESRLVWNDPAFKEVLQTPLPIVHCVVVGIPVTKKGFAEGELSKLQTEWPVAEGSFILGRNTFNDRVYTGPKPPAERGRLDSTFERKSQ